MIQPAVLTLALASGAVYSHAQEDKGGKARPEREARPQQQREARPERREAPSQPRQEAPRPQQRQEATPRTQRQETPQQPRPEARAPRENRPDQVQQPRRDVPSQPRVNQSQQPQPRRESPAQVSQPRPAEARGRTFGTNPGSSASAPRETLNRPAGAAPRAFTTRSGDVIHRDAGGQVRQVRMSNGTTIYRPAVGPRRVEVVRPGGTVIHAAGVSRGYVQRPIVVQNTTVIKRTYIYNGVPQARFYRPRVYNGITFAVYTPVRYYRPAFYGWVYNPWPAPVYYSWGWAGSPWYGYYGPYFRPYPVYYSPSLWLTDFMIASMLESAYQERMADRAYADAYSVPPPQTVQMSPEVKQAIADEVRWQVDRERAASGNAASLDAAPDDIFGGGTSHVFVVSTPLVVNASGSECTLQQGDVLRMASAPPRNALNADVVVLSSVGGGCRVGASTTVPLQELQEMANQMRATLDRGMNDLQSKQGQNGIPALPPGAAGAIDTPLAHDSQPDPNAAREIADANREADRDVQRAESESSSAPPVLTLGMDLNQVKAIQGDPEKIVDLGPRQIYVYKDLKITFQDGKVSDIQ